MMIRFLILFFLMSPAYAGVQLGISTNYLVIKDKYSYPTTLSKPVFNIGYSYNIKPLLISLSTNRIFNQIDSKQVTKDNLIFDLKSKVIADTLIIGYPIKRFIPSIFFTNAEVRKSLYYNDRFLGKTKQNSILYGLNFNYYYNKNFNFYTSIIAPNREQKLQYGINFGINYNL